MFFPMLRRRAKWVFLFLAFAFVIGFVVFGVGTGSGFGGISDLWNNNNGSSNGGPSAAKARDRIKKNPKDAAAYQELSTALLTGSPPDVNGAIAALDHYTQLKPKNTAAYTQLAGLYQRKATNLTSGITAAQNEQSSLTANPYLQPQATTPATKKKPGKPLFPTPAVDNLIASQVNTRLQNLQAKQKDFVSKAEAAYQNVAHLQPKNSQVQLELGSLAYNFGDIPIATLAFKKYLLLAPASPQAPLVRKQLKALKAFQNPTPTVVKPTKHKAKSKHS
jgi:hypothetical protein